MWTAAETDNRGNQRRKTLKGARIVFNAGRAAACDRSHGQNPDTWAANK